MLKLSRLKQGQQVILLPFASCVYSKNCAHLKLKSWCFIFASLQTPWNLWPAVADSICQTFWGLLSHCLEYHPQAHATETIATLKFAQLRKITLENWNNSWVISCHCAGMAQANSHTGSTSPIFLPGKKSFKNQKPIAKLRNFLAFVLIFI